jgi:hypothetical protein
MHSLLLYKIKNLAYNFMFLSASFLRITHCNSQFQEVEGFRKCNDVFCELSMNVDYSKYEGIYDWIIFICLCDCSQLFYIFGNFEH